MTDKNQQQNRNTQNQNKTDNQIVQPKRDIMNKMMINAIK